MIYIDECCMCWLILSLQLRYSYDVVYVICYRLIHRHDVMIGIILGLVCHLEMDSFQSRFGLWFLNIDFNGLEYGNLDNLNDWNESKPNEMSKVSALSSPVYNSSDALKFNFEKIYNLYS